MNIRYGNTYELLQLSDIGTNCTRRKISLSMGPWNKPERRSLERGFMPRKPVDRRRAERDPSGLPSGNIDLKQRKDWSIWADKMISSRGIYRILSGKALHFQFLLDSAAFLPDFFIQSLLVIPFLILYGCLADLVINQFI